MTAFRKWPKLTIMQRLQPTQNGQFGSKIKIHKNMRKTFILSHQSCSAQKTAPKKALIFEKRQLFENGQNWPLCKGYSPRKMVSLGPKLKFTETCEKRRYTDTRVVVCKTRLQKRANNRKMTAFRKWPKLATMQRLQPTQKGQFGSKIKIHTNM